MSARDKLLNAAAALAVRDGITALGVEQVAKEAGVSKGSFFYHFATKDDMIRALLDYVAAVCMSEVDAAVDDGARFTDALVDMIARQARENGSLIHVLVASVGLDPSLRTLLTQRGTEWHHRMVVEDGLTNEHANRLRLAIDGLMISTVLYDPAAGENAMDARIKALRSVVTQH